MALSYDLNPRERPLIQPNTDMITDVYKTTEGACLPDHGEVTSGIGGGPFPPLPPVKPIPAAAPRTPAEPAVWELEERPRPPVIQEQRRFVTAEMQLVLPKPITPPPEEDEEEEEWEGDEYGEFAGGLELAEVMAEDYPFIPLGLELANLEYRGEGEFPGEYLDADWKNADKYGYSKKFPYKKMHQGKPGEEFDGEDGFLGQERGPYVYDGDSEMNTAVSTDILQPREYDPDYVYPDTLDKWTQVCSDDIAEEYRLLEIEDAEKAARKSLERRKAEELKENKLKGVPSLQADAETLVRPIGYKPLELSMPRDKFSTEVSTQVNEQLLDEEWAMERGVVLANDDILWPTVEEFDMEKVSRRLYDYVAQCWKIDPKWMFYIHPIQSFTDNLKKRVTFEAKFSVPTPQNPVPPATASVFFVFEMSHYAPRDEVVKVYYVVEGTRFRHYPGAIPFQDKWLWSVITDKIRLQRSVANFKF